MHKNAYYRQVLKRHNPIVDAFIVLFISFASWSRMFLEVFIRKNFGERYLSLSTVLTAVGVCIFVPYWFALLIYPWSYTRELTVWRFMMNVPSTSLFLGLFLIVGLWHVYQIRRGPSVFNFEKLSIYSGDINPLFWKIKLFGKVPTPRIIETVYEPLFFLVIGWILSKLGIQVGKVIIGLSIWYSLSYVAAYRIGDDFIMDKIDEMICNEDLEKVFVDNVPASPRGFQFRGEKPDSREQRSTLADEFIDYEDVGKIS